MYATKWENLMVIMFDNWIYQQVYNTTQRPCCSLLHYVHQAHSIQINQAICGSLGKIKCFHDLFLKVTTIENGMWKQLNLHRLLKAAQLTRILLLYRK